MSLTKPQRARLDKLATYLEGLPKGYRHFDMCRYLGGAEDYERVAEYALKNGGVADCGTVACAVGHGPAAGVFATKAMARDFAEAGSELCASDVWDAYACLFAGRARGSGSAWHWLFDGGWAFCDNGPKGAAARIRYLLDHGGPPPDFHFIGRVWRKLYAPYRIDHKAKAPA